MIDRVLKQLKPYIIQLISEEPDLMDNNLTPEEWQILVDIRDFLSSFYDTTKATEGRQAILDRVLPSLDFMADLFINAIDKHRHYAFIYGCLQAGYSKLLIYWNLTNRAPVYVAAVVLDLTSKYNYFKQYWKSDWQPGLKKAIKLL